MRVVIAAGGTGGHMYPAIAYAKAFQLHDPEGHILFVGTGKAVEKNILRQEGFPVEPIQVEGVVGRSVLSMYFAPFGFSLNLFGGPYRYFGHKKRI